jgi:hypothetical protein
MIRFACRLVLVAALGLGGVFLAAVPAQAHEHWGWAPRVIVRGSYYYPPVVIGPRPVVVVSPTYPVPVYVPTYVPTPVPVPVAVPAPVQTPLYPVYPR